MARTGILALEWLTSLPPTERLSMSHMKRTFRVNGFRVELFGCVLFGCIAAVVGCSREPSEISRQRSSSVQSSSDAAEALGESAVTVGVPAFYSIGHYDETRVPNVDLQTTLKRAKAER